MSTNPFVLPPEQYVRDLNLLKHYLDHTSHFLSTSTGRPIEECRTFVKTQLSHGGKFEFKDRPIRYLERADNGDRSLKESTLLQFLNTAIQKRELIAPNLTTYLHPDEKKSLLVGYIDENVKVRSKAKKEMFAARMAGNKFLETLKNNEQANKKISNNSISGGHVSASTILNNKTAHSTLTSNCRSTSGNGNANNEKLLAGNRHYWNAQVTINNVVSLTNPTFTDYHQLAQVMSKYQLKYPSAQETLQCVLHSSRQYWNDPQAIRFVREFIEKLSDLQRASFVYTSDMYQLAQLNPEMMRELILTLAKQVSSDELPADMTAEQVFKTCREEYRLLAMQCHYSQVRAAIPEDKNLFDPKDIVGTELERKLAAKVWQIHHVIDSYADFFKAFFVTSHVPMSLAFFPESVRHTALTSDTDSTIFTVQDWVYWIFGQDAGFNDETYAVEAVMIFFAAETITHILARMSANFGIETKRIHQIAMKNEYKFDSFVPTQVGKHYFAYMSSQEGFIYRELKKEIKGVHLKSSNVPKEIMERGEKLMLGIMDTVLKNEKVSLHEILSELASVEQGIVDSMMEGKSTYLRHAQVKSKDSYTKNEELSPYQNYLFWQEVFAPKYGDAPAPPYACSKLCLTLKSPRAIKQWISEIKDPQLAKRFEKWNERVNKSTLRSLLISREVLDSIGIPEEIKPIIDIRKTIFDNSHVYYLVLEALGVYVANKNLTRLFVDEYSLKKED